jgi:radical SAM superfamily enzyme YgiQ (UPF0313 family)
LGGNLPRYYKKVELLVDWVCYYEGEKPLRKALLNILNNEILVNSREYDLLTCEELDNIPPIDVSHYKDGVMPIQLGIGCPNSCIFCDSFGSQGKQLRHPSLNKILSDINFYTKNGINYFYIVDDTIFSDKNYYREVFNYIKFLNKKILLIYISPYLDDEELKLISEISLPRLSLNVDACNERTFKLARKNGDFKRIPHIINFFKDKGFEMHLQIIVNYPFETDEDRNESIEFYSNLNIDNFVAVPLIPMKGTAVYKDVKEDSKEFLKKGYLISQRMNQIVNTNLRNK